jgi:hypothetical protein
MNKRRKQRRNGDHILRNGYEHLQYLENNIQQIGAELGSHFECGLVWSNTF